MQKQPVTSPRKNNNINREKLLSRQTNTQQDGDASREKYT